MVAMQVQFLSGRYHATPWGHHVNEGLVEWPPSPWRVLRALIAVGFTRSGWVGEADEAKELVDKLASVLPNYVLPAAVSSHTRHYMPVGAKTTKVLDTFAHVGRGSIWIEWPVQLPAKSVALFEQLAVAMPYLGRAESWVECSVHDRLPEGLEPTVVPGAEGDDRHDLVRILAPMDPESWRRRRGEALLDTGKKRSKARQKAAEAIYPETLTRALLVSTGELQKEGWVRPPCCREVSYRVPVEALAAATRRPESPRRRAELRPVFALLAVTGDSERGTLRPANGQALALGELLHFSLAKQLDGEVCPELTGRGEDAAPLEGHQHVHLVPIDLDGDGRLDHILAWSPMGFGEPARRALRGVKFTYDRQHGRWAYLTLAGFGQRREMQRLLASSPHSPLRESRVWQSASPFLAPRHLKETGRNTLQGQVAEELASRGLPPALDVEIGGREELARAGFFDHVRSRRAKGKSPPSTRPWFLRIHFEQPAAGPLLLGYGSHFGLGQFVPVVRSNPAEANARSS